MWGRDGNLKQLSYLRDVQTLALNQWGNSVADTPEGK